MSIESLYGMSISEMIETYIRNNLTLEVKEVSRWYDSDPKSWEVKLLLSGDVFSESTIYA